MLGKISFIIFILVLLIFFLLTLAITYHLKRYGLSGGKKKSLVSLFLTISLIFFILNLIIFSKIPWKEISENVSGVFQETFKNQL